MLKSIKEIQMVEVEIINPENISLAEAVEKIIESFKKHISTRILTRKYFDDKNKKLLSRTYVQIFLDIKAIDVDKLCEWMKQYPHQLVSADQLSVKAGNTSNLYFISEIKKFLLLSGQKRRKGRNR